MSAMQKVEIHKATLQALDINKHDVIAIAINKASDAIFKHIASCLDSKNVPPELKNRIQKEMERFGKHCVYIGEELEY